jgi:hypothetical protein
MYSRVDDERFDNRGLFDLVRQGALSSGSFSTFLISIFEEDRTTFSYNGDITENGRQLSEFGFRIPLERATRCIFWGRIEAEKCGLRLGGRSGPIRRTSVSCDSLARLRRLLIMGK